MLAGKMRLRTFGTIVALSAIGLGFLVWSLMPERPEPTAGVTEVPLEQPAAPSYTPNPDAKAAVDTPGNTAPVDTRAAVEAFLVAQIGRDLGSKKVKDARPGPHKVNLYQDEGEASVNRAKVDWDRDDKWDEKWTFGTPVTKKVSPDDDEDYAQSFVRSAAGWTEQ